jgi:peptidoglycan/LPS O-acetylase OafA/YrhL
MEEQFYIFWPLLFRFIKANTLKKAVIVMVIAMPFLRVITYFLDIKSRGQITMMLHTAGDTILIGCLGAIMEHNERVKSILKRIYSKPFLILLAFIYLLLVNPYLDETFKGAYTITIGLSLRNIVILIIIFWSIQVETWFSRFLNTKVMVQIGIISYSIYIWQQLFLSNISFSGQFKFPWNIVILTAVAFASYYLLEKPIMNLKNHPKLKRYFS